ncbi:MAG: alpha/beta hydrolase [Pigmentiphaga sp.]|uniref:alpha/beta hydrolase n=1 Tax=Pigmentiphaga sp. TaxID=1977564 RepID=UPI0029A2B21E|nr:alpha/beta hydrolase [Pigmentiphaga sp.]MDX3905830.1 alpha/beta hydrolase [Pigmentiphaga sp.]
MTHNSETTLAGITARIRAIGRKLDAETLAESQRLYAPLHASEPASGVLVENDHPYGPDERHRLDVFRPDRPGARRPALLFVHGGGFVGGDKRRPGSPFNQHVGIWAARQGLVGVNMTYRLAPAHPWPAGPQDVGAAIRWIRNHANDLDVDPARVFVFGQSAGAAHVAAYIGHRQFHGAGGHGLAGGLLLSGVYDLVANDPRTVAVGYYGDDPARFAERSALPGIADAGVPLWVGVAELDPSRFERQALLLAGALLDSRRHLPRFVQLAGHNHLSGLLHLGLPGDVLGPEILRFLMECEPPSD